jgi:RNA polymerase sigma factor (sigma-70 family)
MGCAGHGVAPSFPRGDIAIMPSLVSPRANDPDAGLVERLRRNEAGAVEALVAAYGNRVYRLALRITGNSSDAEEVVQDTFWAATRKIGTFRGASTFGSWIYRITANAAIQKWRGRQSRHGEVPWADLAPSFDELGQHVTPGFDWSTKLEDAARQAELRSVLSAAVDDLPGTTARPSSCGTSKGCQPSRSPACLRSRSRPSSHGSTARGSSCALASPATWARPSAVFREPARAASRTSPPPLSPSARTSRAAFPCTARPAGERPGRCRRRR